MANFFNVPFNFDPVSTTIETTTYSLTAGKYARIIPVNYSAALVIDGETVMPKLSGVINDSTTSSSYTTMFENETGYPLIVNYGISASTSTSTTEVQNENGIPILTNAGGVLLSSSEFSTGSSSFAGDTTNGVTALRLLMPSDTIELKKAGGGTASIRGTYTVQNPPNLHFWAHGGGSGITITGGSFVVELYNSIQ
jgi:hypothetical protein